MNRREKYCKKYIKRLNPANIPVFEYSFSNFLTLADGNPSIIAMCIQFADDKTPYIALNRKYSRKASKKALRAIMRHELIHALTGFSDGEPEFIASCKRTNTPTGFLLFNGQIIGGVIKE